MGLIVWGGGLLIFTAGVIALSISWGLAGLASIDPFFSKWNEPLNWLFAEIWRIKTWQSALAGFIMLCLSSLYGSSSDDTVEEAVYFEPEPKNEKEGDQPASKEVGWLGSETTRGRTPCPGCGKMVYDNRSAFTSHWRDADSCNGPPKTPPESISMPLSEWEQLVDDVNNTQRSREKEPETADIESTSSNDIADRVDPVNDPTRESGLQTDPGSNPNATKSGGSQDSNSTDEHWVRSKEADDKEETDTGQVVVDGGDMVSMKRQEMIKALQELHDDLGRIPMAQDIRDGTEYTQYDYTSEFGSLDEALAEAGYDKQEALLDELRRVADELGRVPSTVDFGEHAEFSSALYNGYFGSWEETIQAAGLKKRDDSGNGHTDRNEAENEKSSTSPDDLKNRQEADEEEPTDEELLDELRSLDDQKEMLIMWSDMVDDAEYSRHSYIDRFGTWDNALEEAGIDKENKLLKELNQVAKDLGRFPKTSDMADHSRYSSLIYSNFFGSWGDALNRLRESELSFEIAEGESSSGESNRDALLDELQRLSEEIDGLLKASDMQLEGRFTIKAYTDTFGSWDEALEQAGIDRKSQVLKEVERVWEELGHRPSTTDMNEQGRISSSMVTNYFDSWAQACQKADPDLEPTEKAGETTGRDQADKKGSVPEHDLAEEELERLYDIFRLQPTKNSELIDEWGVDGGSEVHRYLESHLSAYYYRDADSYIRATDKAEEIMGDLEEGGSNVKSRSSGEQDSREQSSEEEGSDRDNGGNDIGRRLKKKRLYDNRN